MPVKRHATFTEAVELFVEANDDWLSESDQPLITAAFEAAKGLEKRMAASLLSEFRQVMRELHRRKPDLPLSQKLDEFDELMQDFT